jgi:hypothetical protein
MRKRGGRMRLVNNTMNGTIEKTLLTVNLFDGFWDRWLVHGVLKEDLSALRVSYLSKDLWFQGWEKLAEKRMKNAEALKQNGLLKEAEIEYRTAALYYQLIQWLIPSRSEEKRDWLIKSLDVVKEADRLSKIDTKNVKLDFTEQCYYGRVRIPSNPRGVIIIINPLDSAKEELFTYEMDFAEKNYITLSFDGPGQGQTYTMDGVKGTLKRWHEFVDGVIEYAYSLFSDQNIYLFGTSSGAAWAIYGSCHPFVSKAVAVSPPFRTNDVKMPDYFTERVRCVSEEEIVPPYHTLSLRQPVLLVHGKKDLMVKDESMYQLFQMLPEGKEFLEYPEEGHCCNYKLPEIRQRAITWFEEEGGHINGL